MDEETTTGSTEVPTSTTGDTGEAGVGAPEPARDPGMAPKGMSVTDPAVVAERDQSEGDGVSRSPEGGYAGPPKETERANDALQHLPPPALESTAEPGPDAPGLGDGAASAGPSGTSADANVDAAEEPHDAA